MIARVPLFGMQIDPLRMHEAIEHLLAWIGEGTRPCRYVVTPNVDHVVLFQEQPALREAYADADLVLADGFPVVKASRWLGRPLPERVAGSDLVPALFERGCARGLRVFLLGAAPGVAERAAGNCHQRWPGLQVVGVDSPPLGFERQLTENERILRLIADARPDVLVVGFGAPKQELWVHAHRESIAASVALCAGATIDFLAGEKRRAPRWMQRGGLEWLYRIGTDPSRLAKRYARDAWIFPRLLLREWLTAGRPSDARGHGPTVRERESSAL